jgi:hypothetical protein
METLLIGAVENWTTPQVARWANALIGHPPPAALVGPGYETHCVHSLLAVQLLREPGAPAVEILLHVELVPGPRQWVQRPAPDSRPALHVLGAPRPEHTD